MIKCKNCGADMRFDPKEQKLICDYCDTRLDVINNSGSTIKSEERLMDAVVHTCPQCGAQIYTTEDTAATFCSYCGSSVLLESRLVSINKPDYIIPFLVSKEDAIAAYKRKMRRAIFAPASLRNAEISQIRGIYMPYWEYLFECDTNAKIITKNRKSSTPSYTIYEKHAIETKINIVCDGLEYDASSKLPDDLSQSFAPFHFSKSKLFNPGYMSGFYADLGDVPVETYTDTAVKVIHGEATNTVLEKLSLNQYENARDEVSKAIIFDDITPGLAMYPVWFMSARDKKGEHIHYAAVNGETGKVAADLPIDKKKLILFTFIFAIPIFLLLYLLLTPTPRLTLYFVGFLSIVGTIFGKNMVRKNAVPDAGAIAAGASTKTTIIKEVGHGKKKSRTKKTVDVNSYEARVPQAIRKGINYRMLIVILICVLFTVIDPIYDAYYYGAAIVSAILCGWTYWNLFDIHNKLTERPLPQLKKRGGEGA